MLLNNSNSGTNLTNVELSHSNYRVVKEVEGFSSATYIFGIGGLSKEATRDNAVADMTQRANLQGSQALVNVHIKSHVATVLGIYTRVSCAATAQVIEFLPETKTQIKSDLSEKRYDIGDLYDDGEIKGYIFDISDDGLHGRIVYPQMLDAERWCIKEQKNDLPETTAEEDGEENMKIIRAIPDWQNKFPAFAACARLGSRWYLPTLYELVLLNEWHISQGVAYDDVWSSNVSKTRKGVATLNWQNGTPTLKRAILAVAKF